MADIEVFDSEGRPQRRRLPSVLQGTKAVIGLAFCGLFFAWFAYTSCRIDVGTGQMAILIHKTGLDLPNADEVAPDDSFKGVQKRVLTEGRHFFNPYEWDWQIIEQVVIPEGKAGVLIALVGDDLGYGEVIGEMEVPDGKSYVPKRKGIIPDVLRPGRYPIHPQLFKVELVDPVVIDAGFKGVVTNLLGPLPKEANKLLVQPGERGVQSGALSEGRHLINPYLQRISKVDCRSQRYNLAESKAFGFPSKDGFWVTLDGRVQFRLRPEKIAELYVIYNESENGDSIAEEIVRKVIMPNARSFCRLEGSSKLGREFIEGTTRMDLEKRFANAMRMACEPLGIDVQEALITTSRPPEKIAAPIQDREQARLDEKKFQEQIKQQDTERKLAEQKALVKQKSALVEVDQKLVRLTTQAQREQEVAVTKANEGLAVAKLRLDAAKDEAEAIVARGKADADVIGFENLADAAGWKQAVAAFNGNGLAYAQFVMLQKLSSAYRRIMINSNDSPLMQVFEGLSDPVGPAPAAPAKPAAAPDK